VSAPIGGTFPGGWGAVGAARKQQIRLVSIDFPTACWRVLFVLVVLAHQRRRVLHFNVTEHPTAPWTAQQIGDAFAGGPRRLTFSAIGTRSAATRSGNG